MKIWSKEEIEFKINNLRKIYGEGEVSSAIMIGKTFCHFIDDEEERYLYALHYAYYRLKDMHLKFNRKTFGEDNLTKFLEDMCLSKIAVKLTTYSSSSPSFDWSWSVLGSNYGTYGTYNGYDVYGVQNIINPYPYTISATNTI